MKDYLKIYLSNMETIKSRIEIVRSFVDGKYSFGAEEYDYEICCINVRKTLELIAFSSLAANKIQYEKAYERFSSHWRAKDILSGVQKLNPNFYPRPITIKEPDSRGIKQIIELKEGYLTHEEFVALYDRCSDLLHTWNPFSTRPRAIHFGYPMAEWIQRIQKLLNVHYVSFVDTDDIWIIQMVHPEDKKAHGYIAPRVK